MPKSGNVKGARRGMPRKRGAETSRPEFVAEARIQEQLEEEDESIIFPTDLPADSGDEQVGSDSGGSTSEDSSSYEGLGESESGSSGDEAAFGAMKSSEEEEEEEEEEEGEEEGEEEEGEEWGAEEAEEARVFGSHRKQVRRKKLTTKQAAALEEALALAEEEAAGEEAAKAAKLQKRAAATKEQMEVLSSDPDTSDDEHSRNRLGKIPMEWYDDLNHIGYDLYGKRIARAPLKDRLERFLDNVDGDGRTVFDPVTQQDVQLSDQDLAIIRRIQKGELPEASSDPHINDVPFFTGVDKMIHPLSAAPEPKSRFVPSKWEHKKIMKIVRAIRKGWIKIDQKEEDKEGPPQYWDIWSSPGQELGKMHIPAPKVSLPVHAESYNPPREYLFTKAERKQWEEQDPEDRKYNFVPQKYDSLRKVPGYAQFIQERFSRCLDLYLCPRARKIRLNIDPESLIPKLPRPRDLQPFPSREAIVFEGHKDKITALATDPLGQWLASGSHDCTVRLWEVATGRCTATLNVGGAVSGLAWSPSTTANILAVAVDNRVLLLQPGLGSRAVCAAGEKLLARRDPAESGSSETASSSSSKPSPVRWEYHGANGIDGTPQLRWTLHHKKDVAQLTWHAKGGYLASVMPAGTSDAVNVHSLTKQRTQCPFRKNRDIQRVLFHPRQPMFFVASKTHVRVYNLQTQTLVKKLITGVKWLSSMAIHPGGDNLIVGSYDRRLAWFDLDLSVKPYKTLRYHNLALRGVAFHNSYPLFASCSDDGTVHVFHGRVFSDLLQNPLIVPVKILRGHKRTPQGLGVMTCMFHPRQPWVFSAGADATVRLYT